MSTATAPATAPAAAKAADLVFGVIVPCRNEAATIERRLRNLAVSRWPFAKVPHQIVVVDDGSGDDTVARAEALCAELFPRPSGTNRMTVPMITDKVPAAARVIRNEGKPGKAGAVRAAIAALGDAGIDIFVLTDADVIMRATSLPAFEHAFRTNPELGMACGRQEFVADLLDDGSCRGRDLREPKPAGTRYDAFTAAVRAWESRRGRVFSVHGQLLAWRARLGLFPSPGVAADDLDLMFLVRERGQRIELVPGAAFLEIKPKDDAAHAAQQLRRARAWVQVMAGRRAPARAPLFDKLQLAFYKRVPLALPWLLPACCIALVALGWAAFDVIGIGIGMMLMAAFVASPLGAMLRGLIPIIRAAKAAEASGASDDRWDRPGR